MKYSATVLPNGEMVLQILKIWRNLKRLGDKKEVWNYTRQKPGEILWYFQCMKILFFQTKSRPNQTCTQLLFHSCLTHFTMYKRQNSSGDSCTRATSALGSYCDRVDYRMTYLCFASFNAPYNPVRLMYETRAASSKFLILRLMVRKIR